jgi:serine/threonine protein kinase
LDTSQPIPAPATVPELVDLIHKSGAVDPRRLDPCLAQVAALPTPLTGARQLAGVLVRQGVLTRYQAVQLLQGRWQGLVLGKYLILEQLGWGGMGVVYLAEHRLLQRWVAIKVLPRVLARDRWFREQFYHEAQAVAALAHPNIVRAHDVGCEGTLHFLVMEYVDGTNLHDIVKKHGPLSVPRAAHYIRQAAAGLQHAFEAGLVHRDVKPGNLLLDRRGVIKLLDLGLACFQRGRAGANCDKKEEAGYIVGTDDYLSPEQIVNSNDVDIRADVYGLGAAFYFLLTGQAPFADVELPSQKFVAHLTRGPRPIRQLRPDVPPELEEVVMQMMAKNPWERYQTPAAVAEALAPWMREPIPPPPPEEMPTLSAAGHPTTTRAPGSTVKRGSSARKTWVITGGPGTISRARPAGGQGREGQASEAAGPDSSVNGTLPDGSAGDAHRAAPSKHE